MTCRLCLKLVGWWLGFFCCLGVLCTGKAVPETQQGRPAQSECRIDADPLATPRIPLVIPTPRSIRVLSGIKRFPSRGEAARVLLAGDDSSTARLAMVTLSRRFEENGLPGVEAGVTSDSDVRDMRANDFVFCAEKDTVVAALLPAELAKSEALGQDQGYVIYSPADSPVILYSYSPIGLLYASSTLAQLLQGGEEGAVLPNLSVEDFPAFRFRGNNWNLFAEVGGWSYERGDGVAEYEKRIRVKLDLCAFYKINVVIIDGVGWNAERFPGYAAMMCRLNQAARVRGIRLCYIGYSAGYGPPPYSAPVFENRRSFPDGDVYACCGNPSSERVETTRTMGTCLSNRDLLEEKRKNLVDFVRRVQPGMMYLHGLDINMIKECEGSWAMRCPDCRREWPNDSIFAADGMAGAYGRYYNALADAINEIKCDETNYDAARDCLLYMISPNYTYSSEPDAEWKAHVEYFTTVSRQLRHSNIMFGLREQFCNQNTTGFRCREMRAALDQAGSNVPFGIIHFFGGDLYDNNVPFLATPALNECFEGADLVVNGNGNAYQEPQQLLNAEYGWNPKGSAFLHMTPPTAFDACTKQLLRLSSGEERPAELFGENGFLDAACRSLYGEEAGKWIADAYRLEGKQPLSELSTMMVRPSVLLPAWNTLMPVGRFSTFRRKGIEWQRELGEAQWRAIRTLRDACTESVVLNEKAVGFIARAREACNEPNSGNDLEWMESTLKAGGDLAGFTARYLTLFEPAHAAALTEQNAPEIQRDIETLDCELAAYLGVMNNNHVQLPLDRLGGDIGYRRAVVEHLQDELRNMLETLRSGVWPSPRESVWW